MFSKFTINPIRSSIPSIQQKLATIGSLETMLTAWAKVELQIFVALNIWTFQTNEDVKIVEIQSYFYSVLLYLLGS